MIQEMTPSVEMLFFGRPEGLEASPSDLLRGFKESLYPEQGIIGKTDGHIWRVQFISPGDKLVQVVSCFKAMGSPTRGAGGFIGVAVAMASQFKLSEALAAHMKSELDRFVDVATNGREFHSEQTTKWPTPGLTRLPLNLVANSIRHLVECRVLSDTIWTPAVLLSRSNTAFASTSQKVQQRPISGRLPRESKGCGDLSAQSTSVTDKALISTTAGSSLGLELEINELKKSLKQSQTELIQTKELLHAETQSKLGSKRNWMKF